MALTYDKPVNEEVATEVAEHKLVEDTQNNVSSTNTKDFVVTDTGVNLTPEEIAEDTKNMKVFLKTIETPIADGRPFNDQELLLITETLNQVYSSDIDDAQFKARLVLAASWLNNVVLSNMHLEDSADADASADAILLTIEDSFKKEQFDPASVLMAMHVLYKNMLANEIEALAKADTSSSKEETTLTAKETTTFKEVVEQAVNEELKDSGVPDDVVESIINGTVAAATGVKEETEDIAEATRSMYAEAMKPTTGGSGGSSDTNWVGIGLGALAVGALAYAGYCYFSDDGCDTIIVE